MSRKNTKEDEDDGFSFLSKDDVISMHTFVPLQKNPCEDMDTLTKVATERSAARAAARTRRLESLARGSLCSSDATKNALERYAPDIQEMRMERTCIRCGCIFKEINNFMWQCRRHPGDNTIDYMLSMKFPCCGQSRNIDSSAFNRSTRYGCTECDHTDSEDYSYSTEILPQILVDQKIISVRKESIVSQNLHPQDPLLSTITLNRGGVSPNGNLYSRRMYN